MGKSRQGVHGNYNGRVGNVVARKSQGRVILSIYQPDVANPRTTKQTAQRVAFAFRSSALKMFAYFIKPLARGWYEFGTGWSNLIKKNYTNAFHFSGGSWECLYDKVVLSVGRPQVGFNATASFDNSMMTVSWTDNSGGDIDTNDTACIVLANPSKDQALFFETTAKRGDRQASGGVPTSWTGDNVEVYWFMKSADGTEYGDSEYLGSISV